MVPDGSISGACGDLGSCRDLCLLISLHLQLSLVQTVTAKEDLQFKLGFAHDWKINCTQTPLTILGFCYS